MTQSTFDTEPRLIGSDERLATLPGVDLFTLGSRRMVCLMHGGKILELSLVQAPRIFRELATFAEGSGEHGYSIYTEDGLIVFRRSDGKSASFSMEWDGLHGAFDQATFSSWVEHCAHRLRIQSWEPSRRVHPWHNIGQAFSPARQPASIIGD